jgi:putative hemolysin
MSLPAKHIDIREVIRQKNPNLLRLMPAFVLGYIRRILHEQEMNDFLVVHGSLEGLPFVEQVLKTFGVRLEVVGAENIPLSGGVIFASNHPMGGLDGLAMMQVLGQRRSDLKFLINDIVANVKQLSPFFVAVNKHGSQERAAVRAVDEALRSESAFVVFPAGLVSRKQAQGIADLEWKKTFVSQARKYQKPVVPVYIEGHNSNFFYNLARLRRFLGIKANIEMFYLVDEMFAQKGKTIRMHFGEPIAYDTFDRSRKDGEWAAWVREQVYRMRPLAGAR